MSLYKMISMVIVLLFLSSVISSCKDGGGGGSSPNPQTIISLKTSTLRTSQPGDSWTYGNVSGTSVEGLSTTPSATINFTGTFISSITSSVMTSPTPSIACKVQDDHSIISSGSSTLVDAHDFTYFTQDSTGVYKYGEYSQSGTAIHWMTTPPYNRLEIGSPVSLGTTTSSSVTYSNGVTETRSYTVAAKEYVSIGNIDYESYKIVSTITTTYSGATYESSTKNITSWLVPGLGYVKQHQTEYDYKTGHALDAILDFTATLTSTNVSYGGGGGVTVDNSKAIGTFTGTTLSGTNGYSVDIYTITFDGAGHGTYSSLSSSASATFNYTVTVPGNDLTIDGTFIGTINAAGNFFTAVDVSSFPSGTNIQMLTGVKKGSGIADDTAITYVGGSFAGGMIPSKIELFSMAMHTPLASVLTYTNLTSGGTVTSDYILASDGTFTIAPSSIQPLLGAVSDDKSIMIFTDNIGVACALKLPGSGMTNAKLTGTYKAYRFTDGNVSGGPAFSASRTTVTFDGNGNGTFQRTADSTGVLGSGTITYTMNPDGTFLIQGVTKGISLADGSVIAYSDDDPVSGNNIWTVIAIKQ